MPQTTPKATLQDLLEEFNDLPVNPDLLPKLKLLLSNEHSLLIDIATLLRIDPSITTRLVKLSNSAYFSDLEPVSSIEESIARLGFKEVYQLVNLEITKRILGQYPLAYDLSVKELWLHSIHSAFLMESLATKFSFPKDIAYTIGLLADVGKVFLSKFAPILAKGTSLEGQLLDSHVESKLFGFSFAQAGSALLQKWKFPQDIYQPIQFQLNPLETPTTIPAASMLFITRSAVPKLAYDDFLNESLYQDEFAFLKSINKPKQDLLSALKVTKKKIIDLNDIFSAFYD